MRLVLLLALLYPHTDAELEDWLDDYEAYVSVEAPSRALMALAPTILEDMRDRHPCRAVMDTWSDDCEIPVPSPASTGFEGRPADRGMGTGVKQWRGLVSSYGWDADIALCLMSYESGGNPNAYNPSGASGLMQVLASWADNFGYSPADLFNPEVNLDISYALYVDGGWSHWAPWNRGECH